MINEKKSAVPGANVWQAQRVLSMLLLKIAVCMEAGRRAVEKAAAK